LGESAQLPQFGLFSAQRCVIWITSGRDLDNQITFPSDLVASWIVTEEGYLQGKD